MDLTSRYCEIYDIAQKAIEVLKQKKCTIAVAESITGGGFAHYLTSVPGSSEVVLGGLVTYTLQMKTRLLNVPINTIDLKGIVSREVAIEMAYGVKSKFISDVGMGVTGYAGPSGGDSFAPVGRVFWGFVFANDDSAIMLDLKGEREEIRLDAILKGFEFLITKLS
jgi:PncC family amidohydrolase